MKLRRFITITVVLLVLSTAFFHTSSVQAKSGWQWPVSGGHVNDGFMEGRRHTGIDIMKSSGEKIMAVKNGKVVYSSYHSEYGNLIVIKHKKGFYSYYAHCSKKSVKAGETVKKGEKIGTVGSTGRASASHVHFEIRKGSSSFHSLNSSMIFTFNPKNPLKYSFNR